MTEFEKCCLTVSKRMIDWEPVDDSWPIILPWEMIGDFLRNEFGIYEFIETDYILAPDEWPVNEDMVCMCGKPACDDIHYLLQYGRDNDPYMGQPYWVEWEMWVHPYCLPGFFEMITGGTFYEDECEWMGYRDDPMGPPV